LDVTLYLRFRANFINLANIAWGVQIIKFCNIQLHLGVIRWLLIRVQWHLYTCFITNSKHFISFRYNKLYKLHTYIPLTLDPLKQGQIFLRDAHVLPKWLSYENTEDVSMCPVESYSSIAIWSQFILEMSSFNSFFLVL
jgi:hypothetical protein